MATVLILGAKSDIARALERVYARNGYNLYLAARNAGELENDVTDLKLRYGIEAAPIEFDVTNVKSHKKFYDEIASKPDGVVCLVGYLGDQQRAETIFSESKKIIETNFTGCVSILNIIANDFEQRKSGFIIGISSVAGDRGRRSNYIYGSAKAGFTAYLSGLRGRLYKSGVGVLTVKPGFVYTKMTEDKDLPAMLTAEPEDAARDIYKAQQKGKEALYTKWFWRYIMLLIKGIPEKIFKRLNV